jgi:hypothetical protein
MQVQNKTPTKVTTPHAKSLYASHRQQNTTTTAWPMLNGAVRTITLKHVLHMLRVFYTTPLLCVLMGGVMYKDGSSD